MYRRWLTLLVILPSSAPPGIGIQTHVLLMRNKGYTKGLAIAA
jgi:hypothetical protein